MKIRVVGSERLDQDTIRFTVDVDHKPGTEDRVTSLGEGLTEALQDGKISLMEAFYLLARLAGV